MPAVSVLMVCHRDTPYLRPAIASVLAQTMRDLELVLVDNGAGLAPGTLGEAGRDPRVKWVRLPRNAGIPAGHNAGVAAAQGEYIALLDHDDVMLPVRLERQVARLRAEPALGLVSSCAETIDGAGRVTGREFALIDGEAQRRYTQFAAPVVTPAYAGRREVFTQLPYRPEFSLTADFDFLARAAEQFTFAAVPEVLLQYRRHSAQATVAQAARIAAERCVVRLLAARRRAGRAEGEDWRERLQAVVAAGPDESRLLREYAAQFLAENLWVQAAYHARRSLAVRRSGPALAAALQLFARTWWRAEVERHPVSRMFFLGPVRALRLQPG
jgi:glycosyltransferase involved in cell wall biosynthesis